MFKSTELGADDAPSVWYAQDGKGAIWRVDLSHSHTVKAPSRLLSYHAGKINGMDTCPIAHFAASTGDDGTVRVHDYLAKQTLVTIKGEAEGSGTSLLWLPKSVRIIFIPLLVVRPHMMLLMHVVAVDDGCGC